MRNLVLTAIAIIASLTLNASGSPAPDYIKTEKEIQFFETVKHGFFNFLVAKNNEGERKTYKPDEIQAFQTDGRVYERLPRIKNGKPTDEFTFMELVEYKHGLKIYKQKEQNPNGSLSFTYHLFNQKQFLVSIDKENENFIKEFIKSRGF